VEGLGAESGRQTRFHIHGLRETLLVWEMWLGESARCVGKREGTALSSELVAGGGLRLHGFEAE
jgi:hypothetical protein